jgi:hypothetical protein
VIVDACSAASFVEGRGPLRGQRKPLPAEQVPFGDLAQRFARVGFVPVVGHKPAEAVLVLPWGLFGGREAAWG